MTLTFIALGFIAFIGAAYRLYGRWIANQFALDDARATPAVTRNDGVDFVPTKRFYLFGQHFSAIAAAGPIAGPIIACQAFGWLPCLLWIGLGVVFIGAVHDFTTLAASVRHEGRSIADIVREHLGSRAGIAMMAFIWIALVYVIVAFADITAGSFATGTAELASGAAAFNPGGAVAAASILYLLLAIVMGLVQRFLAPPLWLQTAIFVPLTFVMVFAGTRMSNFFTLDAKTWGLLILGYCVLASLAPVWLLLQPRGYLGGFVLFVVLALGVIGLMFGGYPIEQPAFRGWDNGGMTGALFPFLFVTIACGACSGFHGLVCSGTTSKQLERESHARSIGYGGMLAEAFVALIALVTVMIVAAGDTEGLSAGTIYGNGIGRFLTLLIGEEHLAFAITFGAMAFSTFVFDTLDVSMRLGRYIVQELAGWTGKAGAVAATLITVALPSYFVAFATEGSWLRFWTLFGASNQLLAALGLLGVAVWLRQRRQKIAWVLVPMVFVLTITLWSLVELALGNIRQSSGFDVALMNAIASVLLIVLALYLVAKALLQSRGVGAGRFEPDAGSAPA